MRRALAFVIAVVIWMPDHAHARCESLGYELCERRTIVRPIDVLFFKQLSTQIFKEMGDADQSHLPRQIGSSDLFVIDADDVAQANEFRKRLAEYKHSFKTAPAADVTLFANATPNDYWWPDQASVRLIGAEQAWDINTDGRSVVVAVVDSGVQLNHIDLKENFWRAHAGFSVNLASGRVTCDKDDIGYDAVSGLCKPEYIDGHGSHMAGIIGARGNNTIGIAGINWQATMMPVQFFQRIGQVVFGCSIDAIEALDFVLQAKGAGVNVGVVNASWGSPTEAPLLKAQIEKLVQHDILFVAAAGNCGTNNDEEPYYPASWSASLPNMLSVAASDLADGLNFKSNNGPLTVEMAAPGAAVMSTVPTDTYISVGGTSMAAAHVSGAAALVMATCGLTAKETRDLLLETADRVATLKGDVQEGRRLNLGAAMETCKARSTLKRSPTARIPHALRRSE